ncbi:glycoside hydrolase family 16 protein [Paraurantiacibacter namhicola]|uniref:Beta-glucanase n=1 Tax=Paraurantiacibacter namhicola TaxID=645517 RepID=A0A1C7D7R8_9SPHN|nr:glycoside hydrolase family 16 protein [Paraurantiacibacter namhicola]ANU07487.1 Beta-glucanase precursor [Paraurantiacibacter namhicola]
MMRISSLLAATALLAACGGDTSPPKSAGSGGPGPGPAAGMPQYDPIPFADPAGTLELVWSDEFDAGTLDRSIWNVEGPRFFVNNEQQAYIDRADVISFANPDGAEGGALVLKPVWEPGYTTPTGRKVDFVSGRIDTANKYDVTYGKVSARLRMPDAVGVWPAFWMLGYGQWPDSGETDIMEYVGDPSWTNAAMHGPGYSGETPIIKRYYFPEGQDVTGWHTYSVERTPDGLIFAVDDIEYYRVSKADIERYGEWRFDRPQNIILNFAMGGIYPAKVNFIEKPYYGIPAETVERVKAGELFMEVDWVRVYQRK